MKKIISLFLLLLAITSCSLFQETTSCDETEVKDNKDNTEEVYVFDEATEVETNVNNNTTEEIAQVEQEVSNTIPETKEIITKEVPTPATETTVVTEEVYNEPTTTAEPTTTYEKYQDYNKQYYLQLGAFSTLKRAERFSANATPNVSFSLSVFYNSTISLYIVRSSAFATRGEVQAIRDDFRRRNIYKDAFIVTE